MSQAQYDAFKGHRWKRTSVAHELNDKGGKESVSQRKWRQIRDTIFPPTDLPPAQESDMFAHSSSQWDTVLIPHCDANLPGSSSPSQVANLVPPSTSLPSDSGYESLKRDTELLPSLSCILEESKGSDDHLRDDASDSVLTLYSDGLSLPDADQDNYKSEFCEAIFYQINTTNQSFETLKDSLPELLRSFALRLGSLGSPKDTEVMWFIHKHRYDIARRFCEAAEGLENGEALPETESEPFDKPDIIDWLRGLSIEKHPEIDSLHSALDEEVEAELEERPPLLDLKGYRETVFKSIAFRWLVDDLLKSITLQAIEENASVSLRRDISRHLEKDQYISKRKASKRYTVTFAANWNPEAYLREQFEEPYDLGRLLGTPMC
ncbi:hypothetical protein FNYG_03953 [Fusarium nygamai]|uniref:Uncharacterized protein n=1 Tax=Gibberella nygamai TaxID=42673 RepID=A0A2K0WKB9_GIBNY|nr:hypothetical protein FNYG_03953 [Fusarium nygamai]